jgi:hypothetical protein
VHPTLGSLAKSQAFFYASAFSQSDGVPPPAPARVTHTVRHFIPRRVFSKVGKMSSPSNEEDIVKTESPKILKAIEKYLKPEKRGFMFVFLGVLPLSMPSIHFESAYCKMRIKYTRDRPYEDIEMHISYGRQHAPYEKDVIEWNNEKCYCWHSLENSPLLHFLDGLSPAKASETKVMRVAKEFRELGTGKGWTVPEYWAKRHAFTWQQYEQQLFDLFDLRYPNRWDEYSRFFKEYILVQDENQKRLGTYLEGLYNPPRYKIC